MFKNALSLLLVSLAIGLVQDLSAARDFNQNPDVYRRYENRGDLDYRNNWMAERNPYLKGESPFKPYTPPGNNQRYYQYNGQVYRSDLYDRPYHRGDWNTQTNWRYDKNAYLRGTIDQSNYYRAAYGQGAVNGNYYVPNQQYHGPIQYQSIPGTDSLYFNNSYPYAPGNAQINYYSNP